MRRDDDAHMTSIVIMGEGPEGDVPKMWPQEREVACF